MDRSSEFRQTQLKLCVALRLNPLQERRRSLLAVVAQQHNTVKRPTCHSLGNRTDSVLPIGCRGFDIGISDPGNEDLRHSPSTMSPNNTKFLTIQQNISYAAGSPPEEGPQQAIF
jgi:hypothetical protein